MKFPRYAPGPRWHHHLGLWPLSHNCVSPHGRSLGRTHDFSHSSSQLIFAHLPSGFVREFLRVYLNQFEYLQATLSQVQGGVRLFYPTDHSRLDPLGCVDGPVTPVVHVFYLVGTEFGMKESTVADTDTDKMKLRIMRFNACGVFPIPCEVRLIHPDARLFKRREPTDAGYNWRDARASRRAEAAIEVAAAEAAAKVAAKGSP